MEDAAGLVRVLGAVVTAHLLSDDERLDTLLSQITATQCAGLAGELDLIARVDRDRQAVVRRSHLRDASSSPSPQPTAEASGSTPSGPLAEVVVLDPWSRRLS